MTTSDIWSGTDTDSADPGPGGLPANQAFSLEVVFKSAMALLREQPALLLLAVGAMLGIQLVAFFGTMAISIGFAAISPNPAGDALPEILFAQLPSTVGQLGISILAALVQQLIIAGLCVGVARTIEEVEFSPLTLLTQAIPALKGLLYLVTTSLLMLPLALVLFAPAPIAAYLVFANSGFAGIGAAESAVLVGVVLALLGLVAWAILGTWLWLGLWLGTFAAILDGLWPIDALSASWNAARGARLTLFANFVVFTVAAMLGGLGIYCCGVGLLVVAAIQVLMHAGLSVSWLLYTRPIAENRARSFFERNSILRP